MEKEKHTKKKENITDEIKKLKKWYSEEIKRRDKIIDELKERNEILMKASLKSSNKIAILTEKLKKNLKT